MSSRIGYTIAVVALATAAAAVAASEVRIKPGMWKFTRTVTSYSDRSTPSVRSGQPNSSTSCDHDGKGLLAEPRHSYCRFVEKSFTGGRVNASEQCTKGGATTTIRYNGRVSFEAFDITEKMTVADAKGAVVRQVETQFSAHWVGQCRS